MRLDGRTALVTGGTQGVGGAIAIALAKAGANVVIHGLREDDQARETLDACRACQVRAHLVTADLNGPMPETVYDLAESAVRVESSIDLLVNNAGSTSTNPFWRWTPSPSRAPFESTSRRVIS